MSAKGDSPILILFGSQTGAAKSIAESLHADAKDHGLETTLASLNDFKSAGFESAVRVVVVCSTTGNGDPPANAEAFWSYIRRRSQPKDLLAGKRFAILGLGDTNYDKFCHAAKTIHKRFQELGGTELFKLACADEAMGLEAVVEPWTKGLWRVLRADTGADFGSGAGEVVASGSGGDAAAAAEASDAAAGHRPAHSDAAVSTGTTAGALMAAALDQPRLSIGITAAVDPAILHDVPPEVEEGRLPQRPLALTPGVQGFEALFPADALRLRGMLGDSASDAAAPAAALVVPEALSKGLPKPPPRQWRVVPFVPPASGGAPAELPSPRMRALRGLVSQREDRLDARRERRLSEEAHAAAHDAEGLQLPLPVTLPHPAAANAAEAPLHLPATAPPAADSFEYRPPQVAAAALAAPCDAHTPARVRVRSARYLTAGGRSASRRVVHVSLDVSGTPLVGAWSPGDSIAVEVPNAEEAVHGLLRRLAVPGARAIVSVLPAHVEAGTAVQPQPLVRADSGEALTGASPSSPPLATAPATASPLGSPSRAAPAAAPAAPASSKFAKLWLSASRGLPPDTLPVADLFRWCLDVSSAPTRALVRALADCCGAAWERLVLLHLSSRAGRAHFDALFEGQRLTLLELLLLFPSCRPGLDLLVSALPPLQPRYYSLACSPLADPCHMAFAFTAVEYAVAAGVPVGNVAVGNGDTPTATGGEATAAGIARVGLATSYLERLCAPLLLLPPPQGSAGGGVGGGGEAGVISLLAFPRPNRHFNVPSAPETPFIMVGPGTGVAPFVGFLQHRQQRMLADKHAAVAALRGWWRPGCHIASLCDDDEPAAAAAVPAAGGDVSCAPAGAAAPSGGAAYGKTLLFFGNRHPRVDFLYEQELRALVQAGALTRLVTAFSREAEGEGEGAAKLYVQQRLRECGREVADMVADAQAAVFVCGDGKAMAKDVEEALVEVLAEHRPDAFPSRTHAKEALARMSKVDRYCRDVWS